jgi:uncharacterized protein YjgD (DUF1641 family)
MATVTADAALEAKLDALTLQLSEIGAELREQRARREAWDDLRADFAPLAGDLVMNVTRELEDIGDDVDPADLLRLVKRLARNTARIEQTLERFESVMDLVEDAGPLAGDVFAKATNALQTLDDKGYFGFTQHAVGVVDRVVIGFTNEDIDALADNVVLILNTVKDMTQPEIMGMLQRTAVALEEEVDETPSMRQLLKLMRDPGVKRGIARFLRAMQSAGGGPVAGSKTED